MKKHTISFLFYTWFPVLLITSLIFYISSYPTATVTTVQWQEFSLKKFAHLIWSFSLALSTYRALLREGYSRKVAAIGSIIFVFFYGCSDEIHQRFVLGRESRFRDVLIDTLGASIGILTIWNILPRVPTRLKSWAKKLDIV